MNSQIDPQPRSLLVRILRWVFCWRMLKRLLIALASVYVLIVLVVAEENWRGKHAWEKCWLEWEAKGERFDMKSFAPPVVPDDQNFAAIPFWKENGPVLTVQKIDLSEKSPAGLWGAGAKTKLEEWQAYYRKAKPDGTFEFPVATQPQSPAADVLLALSRNDATLQMLRDAAGRPAFSLSNGWSGLTLYTEPSSDLLKRMRGCGSVLQLRAVALLALDRNSEALEDVRLSLRLGEALRSRPLLITELVRYAMISQSLQPIWEGLVDHKWTDPQLATLERELGKVDFITDYPHTMRGERAYSLWNSEYLKTGNSLAGLFAWNQIALVNMYFQDVLPLVDVEHRLISPVTAKRLNVKAETKRITPYNFLALMSMSAISKAGEKCARAQAMLDLARVACALERYRLANGSYPETLAPLEPKWIAKLPHDIINGEPLKYRPTDKGRFLLYSVGWNVTDDGGKLALTPKKSPDVKNGDWVWPWPAE